MPGAPALLTLLATAQGFITSWMTVYLSHDTTLIASSRAQSAEQYSILSTFLAAYGMQINAGKSAHMEILPPQHGGSAEVPTQQQHQQQPPKPSILQIPSQNGRQESSTTITTVAGECQFLRNLGHYLNADLQWSKQSQHLQGSVGAAALDIRHA